MRYNNDHTMADIKAPEQEAAAEEVKPEATAAGEGTASEEAEKAEGGNDGAEGGTQTGEGSEGAE